MSKKFDPSDPNCEFDSASSNTYVNNTVSNDDVSGNTQNNELTNRNYIRGGDPGFGLPPGFDAFSDSQKSPVVETERSKKLDSASLNNTVDNAVQDNRVSDNSENRVNNSDYANNQELHHSNSVRDGDPCMGLSSGFEAISDSQKSPVVETEHIKKIDSASSNNSVQENSVSENSENSVNTSDYMDNKELHHSKSVRDGDPGFGWPLGYDQPANPQNTPIEPPDDIEPDDIEPDIDGAIKALSKQGRYSIPYLEQIWKFASWIVYLIVAVLFLFSISQFAHFYSSIKSLPIWLQWICFIVVIACLSFIIWTCFIIIKKIWSFPKKTYLDIRALEILSQRQELRNQVNQKFEEGKKQLEKYLNSFDLEKPDEDFKALFTEDEFKKLIQGKKILLSEDNWDKPQEWIHDFQGFAFQGILDSVAKRIVKRYSFAVASGTAISPKSFVDQTIVVMGSIAMTKDLLTLYRIQPAVGESIYLLAQGLFIAYIGGKMQWATGSAMEIISESQVFASLLKQLTPVFSVNAANGLPIFGSMVKPVAAKCTEGMLNYMLIQRLGKSIIKQLQPTEPRK